MKHLWATAFMALGSCLIANAQSGNTEKELIALEQSFSDALLRADWKTVEQIEADDLVFTNADGPVTHKSDEVGAIKSGDMKFEFVEMSDVKVQDLSNVAVVTGKLVERGRYKTADLSGAYRFTDVWAKRNGRWQLVAGQETRVESASMNSAGDYDDQSRTLKRLEQDWLDAYREGDADKMGKILADDFIGRWADGSTQTKDEQLRAIRTGEEKHSTNQLVECNVRIYGDTAVVTGIQTEQSILGGRDGSGTYSYTDVFVKRDGRWQVVASETKRVSSPSANSNLSVRDHLIGTWRLVSAGTFRRDGSLEPYPEYGPNARGYLMYDSTGHMCVSLANPNHPRWGNAEKPTDTEKVRSYDVFFAYCGTYEVREKEGRIIHRPEMGSWPHYIGTDQNRNFRLEGDRLILSDEETPPNGEHRRYQITWQHVSPTSYAAQEKQTATEEELMQLESAWAKAEEAYDPKMLNEILGTDFLSMDETGKIRNRAQEIASDGEWNPPGPEVVDDMSIRIYGDTAVVLGRFTWTDRNSGSVTLQGRFVDTFLRRDGRWQVVADSYVRTDSHGSSVAKH